MKLSVTSAIVLALAAAAFAANTTEDTSKSRAFPTSPDFGKTVERVLARALGTSEARFSGLGSAISDLLDSIPATLSGLESTLIVAAPIIAVVGLILGIISLTKVGALYSHLGLSSYDTVKEAFSLPSLLDFGLPGRGYPAEGEYAEAGHYDPTQYQYHEDGPSSYTNYVARRSGGAADSQQTAAEAQLSRRTPPAAAQPVWN